jgi:hypothetical protein
VERLLSLGQGRSVFILTVILWLLYTLLTLFSPQPVTYQLTRLQVILLQLTLVVPVLFIWLAAVYGVIKFKKYAYLIKASRDGHALNILTTGLLLVICSTVIQTLIGVLRWYVLGSTARLAMVVIYNHLPLVISLVAFGFIYTGATRLGQLAQNPVSRSQPLVTFIPFTIGVALFAVYFYTHIDNQAINGMPNFALPGKGVFYSLALPYLVVWLLGLLSIIRLSNYARFVKGALYREAVRYLILGTTGVITFTAFMQILTVAATGLSKLSLGPILLIIYVLLLLYSAGFILIAVGARKLTRIAAMQ